MIRMEIDKSILSDIESKHKIYFKEKIRPKLEKEISNFKDEEKKLLEYLNRDDIFENLCCGNQKKLVEIIEYVNTNFEDLLIMNLLYEINHYFYERFQELDENDNLTIDGNIKKDGIDFLKSIKKIYLADIKIYPNIEKEVLVFEYFIKNESKITKKKFKEQYMAYGVFNKIIMEVNKELSSDETKNKTKLEDKLKDRFIYDKFRNKLIEDQENNYNTEKKFKGKKREDSFFKVTIFNTLNTIFNYTSFSNSVELKDSSKKEFSWGRHELISKLGITVCPYCDRQYITNYKEDEKDEDEKTTADLDHFYIKSKYPYLALSLYNFVPSCQICNSRMKGSEDFLVKPHVYPYKGFEKDVYFTVSAQGFSKIMNSELDYEVYLHNKNNDTEIENSIETFKLNKVYAYSHNNYINEIYENIIKNPEENLTCIANLFDKKDVKDINLFIDTLSRNGEEVKEGFKKFLKKPYLDRIKNKEPLSKLTQDFLDYFENKRG